MYKQIKESLRGKKAHFAIKSLNSLNLPHAMLIIPDGNGRWAKSMGKDIYEGHRQGAEVFAKILDHFLKINIKVLGAWGFSEDNWRRPQGEVDKIMDVIENIVKKNTRKMIDNNIKFIVLGNKEKIKTNYSSLSKTLDETTKKTARNNGKIMALFVDYGERYVLEEFANARDKNRNASTYELLSKINSGLPLFDMVLRTSGEQRMSGFGPLAGLAEFVSVKKNLPDLTDKDIADALFEYSGRQRRLGGRVG